MSAIITIQFTVGATYQAGDYAYLHGNNGSGAIDWDTPIINDRFDLFPDGAGRYGWGHMPWGHFPWGHGMSLRTPGWGHMPWGHFPWGHGAVTIEAQVEVETCGDYSFAFLCYDEAGNLNELGCGDTIVTNGAFDADSGWTKGGSFSISAGKAHCDGSAANDAMNQDCGAVDGVTYKVSFTLSNCSFTDTAYMCIALGDTMGTHRMANGTYTEIITPEVTEGGSISIFSRSMNESDHFSIDNVAVQQVTSLSDMTTTVVVHIAPPAPTGLKFVSYNQDTDILTLEAA